MKRLALCSLLAALSLSCAPLLSAQEIRAFWADAFHEGFKTPEQIDTLLRRLRAAHCNALFVQMRKGGDAYYLSRYDPWAADNPTRFDALAHLIDRAHNGTPRIQVHAWLNTCAVGRTEGNPFHIAAAHPDWLSISHRGETFDGEATKIDPGHPDAADWTFRVYLDVLRHYNVDGVHFDFVRYGGTHWGYNPVSVARFNARHRRTGTPDPNDPLWKQWRRDQVTALVRKVYVMAAAIKPRAAISAATISWGPGPETMTFWNEKSAAMNRVFQDWRAWMQEGILDLNCLMSYYSEKKHPAWFRQWTDWAKDHQYGRWAVPSSGIWLNAIEDSLTQIEQIRRPSKRGHRPRGGVLLYSYASTNVGPDGKEEKQNEAFYAALSQPSPYAAKPPFAEPAELPAMPWKERPTAGHLKGFVLTADGLNPVDGATVLIFTGRRLRREMTTDGTGFWAAIDLPPGRYRVRVKAKGYPHREARVTVKRGQVATHNEFLGAASTPFLRAPRALDRLPPGTPVRFKELMVVVGTDVFPNNLFVRDEEEGGWARVRLAQRPLLPFQAGDIVAVSGTAAWIEGERAIDNATARLVGISSYTDAPFFEFPGVNEGRALAAEGENFYPWVRVMGRVVEVQPDRFILNDGVRMEVTLSGRKDPGVEAPETPIPAPEPGSHVQVLAAAAVTPQADGGVQIRLRPRSPDHVRPLPTPMSETWLTLVKWMGAACVPAAALLVGIRRWRREK